MMPMESFETDKYRAVREARGDSIEAAVAAITVLALDEENRLGDCN